MSKLLAAALVWALVYLLCQFYEDYLMGMLWVLAGGVWLGLWGVGLVLLGVAGFGVFRRGQNAPPRWQAILALILVLVPVGAHARFGTAWTGDVRFALERPGYEARVRALLASPAQEAKETAKRDVIVDRQGGVVRVAFVQPGGVLDNWVGIVYDPSGAVEKINAARSWKEWQSARFNSVRPLFGGDLLTARPLGGGWYRCSFT